MSAPPPAPSSPSTLSAEELARLAHSHFDAMWNELRAAGAVARAAYHPVEVARRHPLAAAAVAGALLGFLLGRSRGAPAQSPPDAAQPAGRAAARSVLSGLASAAAGVLPRLADAWLARRSAKRSQDPQAPPEEGPPTRSGPSAQSGGEASGPCAPASGPPSARS
jgi:hypothetical protein